MKNLKYIFFSFLFLGLWSCNEVEDVLVTHTHMAHYTGGKGRGRRHRRHLATLKPSGSILIKATPSGVAIQASLSGLEETFQGKITRGIEVFNGKDCNCNRNCNSNSNRSPDPDLHL